MTLRQLIEFYKNDPAVTLRTYVQLKDTLIEIYAILHYKRIPDLQIDSIEFNTELLVYDVVMLSSDTQQLVRFPIEGFIADAPDAEFAASLRAIAEQQRLIAFHLNATSKAAAYLDHRLAAVMKAYPQIVEKEPFTDAQLKNMWVQAGGKFHGPNVETGTMPEEQLLPFLRKLSELK